MIAEYSSGKKQLSGVSKSTRDRKYGHTL